MKNPRLAICLVVVCMMAAVKFTSADTIQGINIDFVTIGNAGNAADTSGSGAVSYSYRIGKYEITNAQWNAFATAAGVPTGNGGGYGQSAYFTGAQQPTNNVSWFEAAQFCNYFTSGNKYSGAYQFDISGNFLGINRALSISTYGTTYVIPTNDEWYKAAYHKNDGVTGNYWLYPTQSNSTPSNALINPDPGNNANFWQNGYTTGYPANLTVVGEFANSGSAYGTFDQGGNVWEWDETLISGSNRAISGGSYLNFDTVLLSSGQYQYYQNQGSEDLSIGFRIASVPEPATMCLLGLGGLLFARKKK